MKTITVPVWLVLGVLVAVFIAFLGAMTWNTRAADMWSNEQLIERFAEASWQASFTVYGSTLADAPGHPLRPPWKDFDSASKEKLRAVIAAGLRGVMPERF